VFVTVTSQRHTSIAD